ncbi:MAG: hypothetical protein MUP85_08630, partial [Candidatus Lokiarchaeota archaeon]|nr:hypothetical protein [Candidatus Lokiarchaeota archaeon]
MENGKLEKILWILDLMDEKIIFRSNPNKFQAELEWNERIGAWIIFSNKNIIDYPIIHELGHIYSAKKIFKFKYTSSF